MSKSIEWALILILSAAAIIVNALDLLQGISIIGIFLTILLAGIFIKGIIKKDFGKIFIPAALIPYVCLRSNFITHDGAIEILDKLTPVPLLISALLLTIAFNILFKEKGDKDKNINWEHEFHKDKNCSIENCSDTNGVIKIKNSLGATIKYVDSNSMSTASISNSFGQTTVYFNNTQISNEGAVINVNNSFGETNVYIPSSWNVSVQRSNTFGEINEHGNSAENSSLPLVQLRANNSFGEINIYFEV